MIIQIIGYWCIFSAVLCEVALISSVIMKDKVREGGRFQANTLNVAFLALAVWCFK